MGFAFSVCWLGGASGTLGIAVQKTRLHHQGDAGRHQGLGSEWIRSVHGYRPF